MCCLACPSGHSFLQKLAEDRLPVVIVVSDQNFPALVPANDGDCLLIIRV
jgi:hypothetical protein